MKKIVIYCGHDFIANTMTFVYNQLEKLHECEIELLIICTKRINQKEFPDIGKVTQVEYNLFDKIYVKLFTREHGIRDDFPYFQKQKIMYEIKSFNPDLIYAFFGSNGLEIYPISKKLNIPIYVSFLGIDASTFLENEFYLKNVKEKLFLGAKIVVLSQNMHQKFIDLGCKRKNLYINHLAVNTEKFKFIKRKSLIEKKLSSEKIVFLQVSRFFEKKGHKFTILAFARALQDYSNLELVLGGDGPLLDSMIELSNSLGISDHIKFLGRITNSKAIELMENSDVFLHHSITASNGDQEGTPTAIIEAMAVGLPVISTYHAGIPEQVIDGKTGFLVNEGDVDTYSKKIIDMIGMDTTEFSINARSHIVSNYNIDIEVKSLINFFGLNHE
jgi:glycosyltransferase involved in cell wall biosynthesis